MFKKLIFVLVVAVAGAGLGGALGYGPLLRYKTEGVISMDMGTSEYKRFIELANDVNTFDRFARLTPPPGLDAEGVKQMGQSIQKGQWHKPVPKVSKADAKELPDVLIEMEKDRDNTSELHKAYLGLRLTHTAADPIEAAIVAAWLGSYVKDVAASEAVREQVAGWKLDNLQFTDRAREQKLKYGFAIEQAQIRAAALKDIVIAYPELIRREGSQVVDIRRENERFISPRAQLVGAESEIIEIRQKVGRIDRELEQQVFTQGLLKEIEESLKQARSGSQAVLGLSAVLSQYGSKVKSDAEREKLLSLTADLSQISSRFLSQAQFITPPSIPVQPERPGPLLVIALGALLSALLAAAFVWRKSIVKLLTQDDAQKI